MFGGDAPPHQRRDPARPANRPAPAISQSGQFVNQLLIGDSRFALRSANDHP
jgi:hypothetical protein